MTKKKRNAIISISIIIVLLLIITIPLVWVEVANNPKFYTEEQHFENVSKLAQKKADKLGKISYKIEPLYNNYDKLFGFLVDYQPDGYSIVMIHNPELMLKIFNVSMYADGFFGSFWRYKLRIDKTSIYENGIEWKISNDIEIAEKYPNRLWEMDEAGKEIEHGLVSPYQVAKVGNERKYFLSITQAGKKEYVPAVKHGEKYLNLISMDEFEYKEIVDTEEQAVMDINFYDFKSSGNF